MTKEYFRLNTIDIFLFVLNIGHYRMYEVYVPLFIFVEFFP